MRDPKPQIAPRKLTMDNSFVNRKKKGRPKGLERWRVFDGPGRFSDITTRRMELKMCTIYHPIRPSIHTLGHTVGTIADKIGMDTEVALKWLTLVKRPTQPAHCD